jgi:hypothetical protein
VNVHVAVHARLHVAVFGAGERDPAMDALEAGVQGAAVEGIGLTVTAPAVDELMIAGLQPFVIEHEGDNDSRKVEDRH